jgi:RNA polymerase sigma-70 factor (sigma-E family)
MVTAMVLPDEAIARDAKAGVEALFRDHYRSLVGLARLLVDDVGQAEEVVQDAFVSLHRRWPKVDEPLAYLRAAVSNGARGRLRKRATARRHLRVAEPAHVTEPDALAQLGEEHRAVAAALVVLPTRQRECVALRFYGGLSEAETAAALGVSAGTVKTHVHRAVATLADILEDLR